MDRVVQAEGIAKELSAVPESELAQLLQALRELL